MSRYLHPTRKATAADSERLRRRNEAAVALNEGKFDDDVDFIRAIMAGEKGMAQEEALGGRGELVSYSKAFDEGKKVPKDVNKKTKDQTFVRKLAPVQGNSQAPETLISIALAGLRNEGKQTLIEAPSASQDVRINKLFSDPELHQGSINSAFGGLGAGGARGHVVKDLAAPRARTLIGDLDRGFNRETGAPFGYSALDAGHIISHLSNPAISKDPGNIMFENAYENRGKAAIEKALGREGRAPNEDEKAQALLTSFVNKITSGVVLPDRRTVTGKQDYANMMNPINDKVRAYYADTGVSYT